MADTFRTYQDGDAQGILDLAHTVFGTLEKNNSTFPHTHEWFQWRALSHPYGLPDIALAVSEDGRIVANQWLEHYELDTPTGRVPLGLALITMADPNHKGFGGLKTMNAVTKRARAEGRICYGLPNDLSLPMFERLKWRHIGNIPVLVRPVLTPMRATTKGLTRAGLRLERIERFDDTIETLTLHPDLPFRFKVTRDPKTLNWRYVDNPLQRYEKRAAYRGNQLVGYVVFRTGRISGVPTGLIMDLLALDRTVFHVLLTQALRGFLVRGQLAASAFCMRGSWFFDEFRKRGFLPVPTERMPKQNALIVLDDGSQPGIDDPGNWLMTYGDWDCL